VSGKSSLVGVQTAKTNAPAICGRQAVQQQNGNLIGFNDPLLAALTADYGGTTQNPPAMGSSLRTLAAVQVAQAGRQEHASHRGHSQARPKNRLKSRRLERWTLLRHAGLLGPARQQQPEVGRAGGYQQPGQAGQVR